MQPRPYQVAAKRAIYRAFRDHRSVLVVLPTGTGKTIIFSMIAGEGAEAGRRMLILAHREELVAQAVDKLYRVTGVTAAVEMAKRKEGLRTWVESADMFGEGTGGWVGDEVEPAEAEGKVASVVVGSVQSMVRRLKRFPPDYFHLVVVDEAHHTTARSYRSIVDHFSEAKVLGVTATPDRGDKAALGQVFETTAFQYEIEDAIGDGWLVPIIQHEVETDQLDLSKCRTTAGDFNAKDLDEVMTQAGLLHEVAGPTVELCGDRPAIVFTVTVKHAYLLAEVLREHARDRARKLGRPEPPNAIAMALDGTADRVTRAKVVGDFMAGHTQYLCNVMLYSEGFDAPNCAAIVAARPTKSRALYSQQLGRGTRTLPGVVDVFADEEQFQERVDAIAASAKPDMLVLDFAGNAGRHKLCNALDVLGGDASPAVKKAAKAILDRGEVEDVLAALRLARQQIAEMEQERLRDRARRGYRTRAIDPFAAMGVSDRADPERRPATEPQRAALLKWGVNPEGMDRRQASRLLSAIIQRKRDGLASHKMCAKLLEHRLPPELVWGLTKQDASKLIAELVKFGWRRPPSWDVRFSPARRHEARD